MNIWFKSLIAGLLAATVFFILYESFSDKTNKSQYKIRYTVQAGKESAATVDLEDAIAITLTVIKKRIAELGCTVSINRAGRDLLGIVIEKARDTIITRQAIEVNGKLEIWEVYTLDQIAQSFSTINDIAEKFLQKDSTAVSYPGEKLLSTEKNIASLIAFSLEPGGKIVDGPSIGAVLENDTALINKVFREPEVLNALPNDLVFYYGMAESSSKGKSEHTFLYLYAIKSNNQEAKLQNRDIESSAVAKGVNGIPEIRFRFNSVATRVWEQMTRKNAGRFLAIVIDENVISAPRVNEAITGGNSSISGGFTMEEAEILSMQLMSGSLPAKLTILKQEITAEIISVARKKLYATLVTFLVVASLSFFIFNSLKSK